MFLILIWHNFAKEGVQRNRIIIFCRVEGRKAEISSFVQGSNEK